jgi:autotransporter-like protein
VGLAMAYDEQKIRSTTVLGGLTATLALSREWGVLSPQIRGDYIHELANDERSIVSHFVQDTTSFRLGLRTDDPDRDYFMLGGGVVAVLPGGLSVFLNFQGVLGHSQMRNQLLSTGLRARL